MTPAACNSSADTPLSRQGMGSRPFSRRSTKPARVVYSKCQFGGPEPVLVYLARYTHRIAISTSQLIKLDDSAVASKWKDNRIDGRKRHKTVSSHLVIAVVINSATKSFGMLLLGCPLVACVDAKATAEADLRFDLSHTRENAETLPLGGDDAERERHYARFDQVALR
jgi:hypothetical protein